MSNKTNKLNMKETIKKEIEIIYNESSKPFYSSIDCINDFKNGMKNKLFTDYKYELEDSITENKKLINKVEGINKLLEMYKIEEEEIFRLLKIINIQIDENKKTINSLKRIVKSL
jgi:hypothetical protein